MDIYEKYPGLIPTISNHSLKLNKKRKKILCEIFENGPNNAYRLSEKLGIGYSSVLRILNHFEVMSFLRIHHVSKTITASTSISYTLTTNGFIAAISSGEVWNIVERNSNKRWKDISPIFFKKWSLFEKTHFSKYLKNMIELIPDRNGYIPPLNYGSGIGIIKKLVEQSRKNKRKQIGRTFPIDKEAWFGIIEEYEDIILGWFFKLDQTPFSREALKILHSDIQLRKRTLEYLDKSINKISQKKKRYDLAKSLFKNENPTFNSRKYSLLFWSEELNKMIKENRELDDSDYIIDI